MNQLNTQVMNAAKWSAIAEVLAKLVGPIANIILARLLTPEAFGAVATITMIISFSNVFASAGFQKVLIQLRFKTELERDQSTTVAFWTNLGVSLVLWGAIIAFRNPLAALVGNPGLGIGIAVACVCIPLEAFSSIQNALFQRDLNFKVLFRVRIAGVLIPLLVTVPLALLFKNYWALIIGTIVNWTTAALLLTYFSKWKPTFYYSFKQLKKMLFFVSWTIVESVLAWATFNVDIFIVGRLLNEYYLGLYKTSMVTVNQIMSLITGITMPVLFSALSRLQDDPKAFNKLLFKFQRIAAAFLFPLGVGIYLFRDFVVQILLGEQWTESADFIGLWALMASATMIFSYFSGEVYRAKGRPDVAVYAKLLHLVVLIPAVILAVNHGFEVLYYTRSFVRLEGVLVNLTLIYLLFRIPVKAMLHSVMPAFIASGIMFLGHFFFALESTHIGLTILNIVGCIVLYFGTLFCFSEERKLVKSYVEEQLKSHVQLQNLRKKFINKKK